MKSWQKYWLFSIIIFFSFHLFRDITQDLGVKNIVTTTLTKLDQTNIPSWYWAVFSNSYVIEIVIIILAIISLRRNNFGKLGYLTIILSLYFAIAWAVYWFGF